MTPSNEFLHTIQSGPLFVVSLLPTMAVGEWRMDWLWSLPIIATTVVFHAFSLRILNVGVSRLLKGRPETVLYEIFSVIVVGGTSFCCTALLGFEAFMWAFAYNSLGAIPAGGNAMLYSINALTSYGHAAIDLQPRWQLMGALEALNGWILFGLTTAFMFNVIEAIWSSRTRSRTIH